MNESLSSAAIKTKLQEFISSNFVLPDGAENLNDEDSFLENGIIDSTGVIELVMFIEETFGFEVQDEELVPDNLDSVNKAVAYIEKKIADAG